MVLVEHGGDGGGHRAEVHGDVLGLHDHLARRVEQRGRAVAALLDVGRVRRAHEHGAHLLAGGAQRAGHDLQRDRVELAAHPSRSRTIVPVLSARPDQPSGTTSVASGRRTTVGPLDVLGLGGLEAHLGARLGVALADRHDLDLALGVAVAVALLVDRLEGLAHRRGVGLDVAHGQLEGLAAVAHVVGGVAVLDGERLGGQVVAVQEDRARAVAAAVGGGEPERAEHARGARHEDPPHAELLGDRGGVQRPGAAEGQQRELARVDAALDGHHAQRADHLGVGHAHDPARALLVPTARARRPARRPPSWAASASSSTPASGSSGSRWPSTRLASVTVGSVPPRP